MLRRAVPLAVLLDVADGGVDAALLSRSPRAVVDSPPSNVLT